MTTITQIKNLAKITAAIAALAGGAAAQTLQIGFQKNGHHGNISIGANVQLGPVREYREALRDARFDRHYYIWVPAHYETVVRQVWVEGCFRDVWVDPVYEYRLDHCNRLVKVCVRAGYWARVQDPGHFETRREQVWVDGRYECR